MTAHTRMFVPCNQCNKLMPTIEWENSGGRCCPTPEEEQALMNDIANSQPMSKEEDQRTRDCGPGRHRFPGGSQYCSHCGITRTDLAKTFAK